MIDKIFHVSDIHIRNFRRHNEYKIVFKRLFQYISSTKTENSIIFLGGDIVHNKTDLSPELVQMTADFLRACSDILPTILILGNHDCSLNNSVRLDALTPIVNSLNHPNLHYWKDSGVYKFEGVSFSVFSVFDSPDKWTLASDIKAKYKIALHHGTVQGGKSDTGFDLSEHGTSLSYFADFDICMLGDLHSQHFLNKEETIGYSSSLIGQNYGESVDRHGILVWDLKTRKAEFVPIKNDYGFFTFDLIEGKCEIPSNLPKNLRTRIRYENTPVSDIEDFVARLSKKYNIIELVKQKLNSIDLTNSNRVQILGDSRDISYQNKIISEFLKSATEINEDELNEVLLLNSEINKLLPVSTNQRNVTWKPLKLEFSNMFSYGEGNEVDFTNFNGIYGIFSKNADGKSSILDILTFVVYDKTTRTSKGSHIMNNSKDDFGCKLSFELSGNTFFIERVGKRHPQGHVSVTVNFWTFDENGEKVNLNGEDRDKTNAIIRGYLGTYDDFIMTALSTQYDNQNFVEKSQRDRKELLYKFLDIFVYDELYRLAKENSKEFQILIRDLERDDLHSKSSQLYNFIEELSDELTEIDHEISLLKDKIKVNTNKMLVLNKQFQPVKDDLNIDLISKEIESSNEKLTVIINELKLIRSKVEVSENNQSEINNWINSNQENFDGVLDEYQEIQSKVNQLEKEVQQLEQQIKHCQSKKSKLDNHKYDPNCKFCIDNEFVKDANEAIELLPTLELNEELRRSELKQYQEELTIFKEKIERYKIFQSKQAELNKLTNELVVLTEKENSLKFQGTSIKQKLQESKNREIEYNKIAEIVEKNKQINLELETIKKEIEGFEKNEKILQGQHRDKYSVIERKKSEYEECLSKLDKYLDYIKKYRIYELYLQALSRDGVPYKIVETILPVLENEVNLILNSVVNFTVRLEATDEKYIHAHIVYDPSNSWPVELSSGMERFILSLAFRSSLGEITSLPKANFLAIDEGFGVLDAENILQMGKMLQYLKSQYDHIICISHIDSMRDMVDKHMKIEKVNGYSQIKFQD